MGEAGYQNFVWETKMFMWGRFLARDNYFGVCEDCYILSLAISQHKVYDPYKKLEVAPKPFSLF